MSARSLTLTSARRRRTDVVARWVLAVATVLALVPLVLVVYYVVNKGASAWNTQFFTKDPTGNSTGFGDEGGLKSAILGTIEIVAIASAIAIPIGIAVALWLTEYHRGGWLGNVVRYFIDVMTGVPAIVFGIFVYLLLVIGQPPASAYAGWKGAIALALLMLPIVARSAEVVLLLVPESLREAALALGAPRWKVIMRIVLPAALPGLLTGSLLAIARAAGETAPLLFTIAVTSGTTFDPGQRMNSLPTQIFNNLNSSSDPGLISRAWGGALVLLAMIFVLNIFARLVSRRSPAIR
ncbi:MAG: phosphate ABC transporter permease PstA [Solirubrobacteraceae bacterium]|nr:MAG: phosphate ABC transporter permease PtsA [Solirubrobacterales bacterium]